ncbi:MAG TPA: hypothetical protein VF857_10175, partial [Spirochaetota bacterium]
MKFLLTVCVSLSIFFFQRVNAISGEYDFPATLRVRVLSNHHPSAVTIRAHGELFGVDGVNRTSGDSLRFVLKNGNVHLTFGGHMVETNFAVVRSSRIDLAFDSNGSPVSRRYEGALEISAADGELKVINEVPFERFVHESAVAELGELTGKLSAPQRHELVSAMEIVIRSFLLREGKRHDGYQFCDLTHCVHFPGITDGGEILTKGMIIMDGKKPVDALFHSTCGGLLAPSDSYWEGEHDGVTFRKGADSLDGEVLCEQSPHAQWRRFVDINVMRQIIGKDADTIECERKDGRVSALLCKNHDVRFRIPISRFLSRAGRQLGWNAIKSNYFDVQKTNGGWVFTGKGLGHGVGLCQYGAARLAQKGKTARE